MNLLETILATLTPTILLWLMFGTIMGIIIGALPGLGPTFAIALFLPLTFTMDVVTALIFMTAIYSSVVYGGAICSILLNIPGHPGAVATTFDGYPLARRGEAGRALGAAATGSMIGGVVGFMLLVTLGPRLAFVALGFSPADYFWLVLAGLSMVALTSKEEFMKGLILSFAGMASSIVGFDMIHGTRRFTMGIVWLSDGFNFVALSVGLFAIAQVFIMFEDCKNVSGETFAVSKVSKGFTDVFRYWPTTLRSCAIGSFIGIIPGIGISAASFFSYMFGQRASKDPDNFGKGKGDIRGIICSETATNAAVGGAMIPTLALGIPGGAGAAMYLVALTIHGVSPGMGFFQSPFIPIMLTGMILAQFAFWACGMLGGNLFAQITRVKQCYLIPITIVLSITGTLAIRGSIVDMWVGLFFGIVGYVILRQKWPAACFILGALLGPMLEQNFFRALRISDGSLRIFVGSGSSIFLMCTCIFIVVYGIYTGFFKKPKPKAVAAGEAKSEVKKEEESK